MSKPTVCFNSSYKNKEGLSSLYLRLFVLNECVRINLKIFVERKYFDEEKGIVTGGKDKANINLLINEALGRASDILLRYKVLKLDLTPAIFVKEFENPCAAKDFVEFMTEEIKERKGELTDSTIKCHQTLVNKLKAFREKVFFAEIDDLFLKGFQKFLKVKYKNGTNTIYKAFKILHTYLTIAQKRGLVKSHPMKDFKTKKEETYPVFLTFEERENLINLYNSGSLKTRLQRVLRWYLFSCYTGLRISDLRAITYQNIINDCLTFKPQKTQNTSNKQITVPLSPQALQLIKDEGKPYKTGTIFACYSDQKMNGYLKEVADLAKVEKDMSFHSGRHTFATMFLKKVKSSAGILILQKLLGHSNIQTTMVYLHVLDQDLKNAISEFAAE